MSVSSEVHLCCEILKGHILDLHRLKTRLNEVRDGEFHDQHTKHAELFEVVKEIRDKMNQASSIWKGMKHSQQEKVESNDELKNIAKAIKTAINN